MPQELQIIRAAEFVRLGAAGHFDLAASKAALAELVRACRLRGIDQALMDLRELRPGPKPVFSREDLIALVDTFREIGFTHQQRLAILYQSDPHHRARLFAFLSTVRGWSVQAFGEFEEALLWLSSGQKPRGKTRLSPGAKKIPVKIVSQPVREKKATTARTKRSAAAGTAVSTTSSNGKSIRP